jgi:tRNA pseudouridine55 synthase
MNKTVLNDLHGALLVDKPAGISSFGVIHQLRKALQRETQLNIKQLPKMGHGGTLDPFATGLLVVLMGEASKLAKYFLGSDKAYEATLRFGATTDSGDSTNPITETSETQPQSLEEIQDACQNMKQHPYLQRPPMYSAKKHEGKRLYELARKGLEVERSAKECQLYELKAFEYEAPNVKIFAHCSSGTYIRTLGQDLAQNLGSLGMLETLRRTQSGTFSLKEALPLGTVLEEVESGRSWDRLSAWTPLHQVLDGIVGKVQLHKAEVSELLKGSQKDLPQILLRARELEVFNPASAPSNIALHYENHLIATLIKSDTQWILDRVFLGAAPEEL